MSKLSDRIIQVLIRKDVSIHAQLFRFMSLLGTIAMAVGGVYTLAEGMEIKNVAALFAGALFMGMLFWAGNKFQQYDLCSFILMSGLNGIFLPVTFLRSGGLKSGMPLWFVLGFISLFFLLRGKSLAAGTVITIIADAYCFYTAYVHPERITYMESESVVYGDIIVSAVITIFLTCAFMFIQITLSEYQRKENEKVRRAKSCADLRTILDKNEDSIICSLIHKYGHNAGNQSDIDQYRKELLKDLPNDFKAKGNIVAFIDECHRTNSGKLHEAVKTLMPDAILIGFTGTPLLKTDKKSSIETFGTYIHTYKFDEGVEDGIVLDLRYEARDVDQDLSSQDKVDLWFENKTRGLTERAKQQLKQSWTSINKLYSSKQRLEKIASDIVFDMSLKPRLKDDRGTAMLVANSIYEACRYWEIFMSMGFTKCAIVTSYEPTTQSVRTATYDPMQESEEEYKKKIYERMLNGKKLSEFEEEVKVKFIDEPAQMKLLIVVDKLLTGFDAPSATYLYIDKSMRNHDLFQAICRVNRPDGEDKDYGYIVDYMDLFRNVQLAVADYTSEAFDGYDKEDVEGLIKNRYDEANSELTGTLSSLDALVENVPAPQADTDYIEYFCGEDSESDEKTARRDTLYGLTASLSRSFANCCDRLVSDYGYTEEDVEHLRREISGYNKIKEMIKLASCDYIDLKPYEADMRYILDTYIRAEETKVVSELGNMSIVELLLQGKTTTPADLVKDLPGDNEAKAETIDNNLQHEIVKKMSSNPVYYGKLSEMLKKIIMQRKVAAMSYQEYLKQVVEMAEAILHPEDNGDYPDEVKNSAARRALFDYFEEDLELTVDVDGAIRIAIRPAWKKNRQKQQKIRLAIYEKLLLHSYSKDKAEEETNQVFDIAQRQEEYDA